MTYYHIIFNLLAIIEFFLVIILIVDRLTGDIEGPPKEGFFKYIYRNKKKSKK